MSAAVHGWERVRRWVRRGLLGLVGLVAFAIAAAVVAIHTPWGRDYVKGRLVDALDKTFRGPVTIGSLEGSPFTTLVARDVVIDDADGRPAVTIDRVSLHVKLLGLLHEELNLDDVMVDGVTVIARDDKDGALNLATMMTPSQGGGDSSWGISIARLAVTRARFDYAAGGRIAHLDDLGIEGGLALPAGGPMRASLQVHGLWREGGVPVSFGGTLVRDGDRMDIGTLHAAAGEIAIVGHDVHVRGKRIAGQVFALATARGVQTIAPTLPLIGDAALSITLAPVDGIEDGRTAAAIAGTLGGATISGGVELDPSARRVTGALRVRGADVAEILRGGPPTSIDALALIDLALVQNHAGVAMVDGTVHVVGGGRYRGFRADAVDAGVGLHDGVVVAAIRAAAPGQTAIRLDAELAFGARGAIDIHRATLVARSRRIDRAAAGLVPARGDVAVDLVASGRIGDGTPFLTAQGRITGADLAYRDYRVGRVTIDLDGSGLPSRPIGHLRMVADSISQGGHPILARVITDARSRPDRRIAVHTTSLPVDGPWKLDLAAVVDVLQPGKVAIALGDHRIRTRGVDWIGSGGTVTIDATTVVARGVSTSIAGGHVAVDGTYHRAGARTGDADAKVDLDHLDLAEVDRSLGITGTLHGLADADIHVTRKGGLITASFDTSTKGLVTRTGVPPIDVMAQGDLAPGKVAITGSARGAALGALSFAVDVDAPRRLDDRRAWARLDRRSIHSGQFVADKLDIKQLACQLGRPGLVTAGRVDGTYTLDAGGATGTMKASGITTASLPAPIDASLAISTDATSIALELDAALRGHATAKATAKLALPDHPFDPVEWADTDPDDFYGGHLRVDGDLGDQALTRLVGVVTPWHGVGSIDVDIKSNFAQGTVLARVQQLSGGPVVEPIDAEVAMTIDASGIAGRVTTILEKQALVTAQFGTSTPPRELVLALEHMDQPALRALPLHAQLTVDRLPIATVLRALGRGGQPIQGNASMTVAVGGTLADPTGTLTATLAGLGTDNVTMRQLLANATYKDRVATLDVHADEDGGGTLVATGKLDVDHLDAAAGTVKATRFDLAPLARLAPPSIGVGGILDADLQLSGNHLATATVGGHLHLSKGELPLQALVGTLRNADVDVVLSGDSLKVVAKGEVGRGSIDVKAQGVIKGVVPTSGTADVTVDHVTLINESQPRLDGIAHVDLKQDGDVARVAIDLRRVKVLLPDDKGMKLHPPGVPEDVVFIQNGHPSPSSTAPPPRRTIEIGERPDHPYLIATIDIGVVNVESSELRGSVLGNLTLTVGNDAMAIDGSVYASSAEIALSDRHYRIEHASVRFDGSTDPLLDIALSYDFPEATLYVGVRGRLSSPDLQLSSDPNTFSQSELLGFLLGGEPGGAPAQGVQDVASGIASSFFSSKVKSYAKSYIGVSFDVLKLEAATSSSSAAVTIGSWISRKLFIAYRQRVAGRYDENASEAEAEYWLGRRIVIDGTAGDRGVDGVDLIWTRRW